MPPEINRITLANQRRVIAFLAMPPLQELDLFGPVEIFNTAISLKQNYEVVLLSGTCSKRILAKSGIPVIAQAHCLDFRPPIDTLVVIGAPEATDVLSREVIQWLRRQARRVRRICSVCTGAFVLAHAGILNGRKATTHWLYEVAFKERFPQVELDVSDIWTKDGHIYTSAGVSTGLDLALALVEEDCGPAIALKIAKGLVLYLRRTGNQKQFSRALLSQVSEAGRFRDLSAWIYEHIGDNLSVERLAQRVKMSPRNFSRQFGLVFGVSPGEYVRGTRIDHARTLLETTELDWKRIASRCGLPGEALRRAFIRMTGISPHDYRKANRIT